VTAYGSGRICVSNACVTGNCHNTNAECTNGKVCLSNTCSACTLDTQCGSGNLCVNSACTPGDCRTTTDCPTSGGLVCINLTCSPCTTDGQCTPYGASICVSSVCTPGNCHSTGDCNSTSQICNLANHTCTACTTDAQCADPANYNTGHFCQNSACVTGECRTAAQCSGGKLCNTSLACVACNNTTECTTALGSNHVCTGGACVAGNCTSTNDCLGAGQLCQGTTCVGCNADTDCTGDAAYGAQHICSNHQCISGNCHTSGDCTTNQQLCNAGTHLCTGCASDASCKSDTTYGSTDICLNAKCITGDCHDTSTECTNGEVCGASAAHACGTCVSDTQCSTDPHYPGDICFQGACGPGNCHATSADCNTMGNPNAGLICGVTTTNTCGTCSSDGQCKSDAAYGPSTICNTSAGVSQGKCVTSTCSASGACSANGGDFCCSATCVAGNCCADADCGSFGTACVAHTCSACNAVSGNKFFVDPVNGNDSTATGSDKSGSVTAPGCAFKTIARAIAAMPPTPPVGTQIVIIGTLGSTTGLAASEPTLPITLPTNTTLTTQGGPITITLSNPGVNNPAGFRLLNNGSGITSDPSAPLTLDGNNHTSGIAIQVAPAASTSAFSLSNVTIQNSGGHGISVTNGILNIGAGVTVQAAGVAAATRDGLIVSGTIAAGVITAAGVVNINVPTGQAQTLFTTNTLNGIEVTTAGSVNIVGVPGAPIPSNNGTVITTANTAAGVQLRQTSGTAGLATSSINGLVSWANFNYGMRLFGGTMAKIRNSIFLGNSQYGVIVSSDANTTNGNNLATLDLGTASDFGHNYLQVPLGSAGLNVSGGLCVALTNFTAGGTLTETLTAAGNEMVASAGTTEINCATTAGTITSGTCGGLRSSGINAATNITTTVTLSMCM
jgi:hypothetical protein